MERKKNLFCIVINHEEQFSVWPIEKKIPAGWREYEPPYRDDYENCVDRIDQLWTDIRPLSQRSLTHNVL